MGRPEFEAVQYGMVLAQNQPATAYAQLRQEAHIASYEGKLAMMQGRNAEALAWWEPTWKIAHTMTESADTLIGYLVGEAVEGIDAAPDWRWCPNKKTGCAGPLMGGAIFYGKQHAQCAALLGPAADRELRDRLVLGKLRSAQRP